MFYSSEHVSLQMPVVLPYILLSNVSPPLVSLTNLMLTGRQITQQADVSTNIWNVQWILQKFKKIQKRKLRRKSALTQKHIDDWLEFSREHLRWKKRLKKSYILRWEKVYPRQIWWLILSFSWLEKIFLEKNHNSK